MRPITFPVNGLFKRTDFFTQKDTSLTTSLGFAVDSFDRLPDEIHAAISIHPQPSGNPAHRFIIGVLEIWWWHTRKCRNSPRSTLTSCPLKSDAKYALMNAHSKRWKGIGSQSKRTQAASHLESSVRGKRLALSKAMRSDLYLVS
jgi:hypothetical protein